MIIYTHPVANNSSIKSDGARNDKQTHAHKYTNEYTHSDTHLSQGHIVEVASIESKAELLSHSLNILERVHSRAEDKEDRSGWPSLLIGHFKWYGPLLNVLSPQLFLNI